jgi:hypothetical protein
LLDAGDIPAAAAIDGLHQMPGFSKGCRRGVVFAQLAGEVHAGDVAVAFGDDFQKLGIQLPKSGLGSGEALQASVKAGNAQAGLEILAPNEISTIQDVSKIIEKGSVILFVITILLFIIALEMVFEKRQARQKNRADQVLAEQGAEDDADGRHDDVSVFPLAIPMIAGPGSIATAMLYMQNADGDPVGIGIVSFAIGANLVLAGLIFLAAGPLIRTHPTPPRPGGVAIATTVSSRSCIRIAPDAGAT